MDSNPSTVPNPMPDLGPFVQAVVGASGPVIAQMPAMLAQIKQGMDQIKASGTSPFGFFGGNTPGHPFHTHVPTGKGFLAQSLKLSSSVLSPPDLARICTILDGLIFENAATPEVQELIRLVEVSVQAMPPSTQVGTLANNLYDLYRDDVDIIIEYVEQLENNPAVEISAIEGEIKLLLSELDLLQNVANFSNKETLLHVCMSYCIFAATDCTNTTVFTLADSLKPVSHKFAYNIASKILRKQFTVKGKSITCMILNNDGTVVW